MYFHYISSDDKPSIWNIWITCLACFATMNISITGVEVIKCIMHASTHIHQYMSLTHSYLIKISRYLSYLVVSSSEHFQTNLKNVIQHSINHFTIYQLLSSVSRMVIHHLWMPNIIERRRHTCSFLVFRKIDLVA